MTFALISLNQFVERFYDLPYTRYFEANAIRFVLNEKKLQQYTLGSLSNDDGDGNESGKKAIGLD